MSQSDDYGCSKLALDIFATICTGGFWLIWVGFRQWRKSRS